MPQLPDLSLLTAADFEKSSFSEGDKECVDVARTHEWVVLRDSKVTPFGAENDYRLVFTVAQFDAFQNGVRADVMSGHALEIIASDDGNFIYRSTIPQEGPAELVFNHGEHEAFVLAVHNREFDTAAVAVAV